MCNYLYTPIGVHPTSAKSIRSEWLKVHGSRTCCYNQHEFNFGINRSKHRRRLVRIQNIKGIIQLIDTNPCCMICILFFKAALNAATKSLSIDLSKNKILCMSMHPGWVKTDMGGKNAPLDVETSCGGMVKTIMELNEYHNGGFYQYDGKKLPW